MALGSLSAHGAALTLACAAMLAAGAAAAQAPAVPCSEDPDYRQLDYLLGEWDAFRQDGTKTADVEIRSTLDGCAASFAWHSVVGGQSGTGFFTYSRLRDTPMFFYAGDRGGDTAAVRAEAEPNDITFIIEHPSRSGEGTAIRRFRLALEPDGSITEVSQTSDNGGPYRTDFEMRWERK